MKLKHMVTGVLAVSILCIFSVSVMASNNNFQPFKTVKTGLEVTLMENAPIERIIGYYADAVDGYSYSVNTALKKSILLKTSNVWK